MSHSNVISIFSARNRDAAPRQPLLSPEHRLKPIEAKIVSDRFYLRRLWDSDNERYAEYAFWERRWGNWLQELIRVAGTAGRDDMLRGTICAPEILILSGKRNEAYYDITLRDNIRLRVPHGRRLHQRALVALRAARLAYETGIRNCETEAVV